MLEVPIHKGFFYDEANDQIIDTVDCVLKLEHSLVSISKWEAKHKKPFLTKASIFEEEQKRHNLEEIRDYVRCMTLNPEEVDDAVYSTLSAAQFGQIDAYMNDPMTASTVSQVKQGASGGPRTSGKNITSELIYYWMTALNIPMECQYWHLNRLMMLIQIASIEGAPSKKMSRQDAISQQRALNKARRAKHRSKG